MGTVFEINRHTCGKAFRNVREKLNDGTSPGERIAVSAMKPTIKNAMYKWCTVNNLAPS